MDGRAAMSGRRRSCVSKRRTGEHVVFSASVVVQEVVRRLCTCKCLVWMVCVPYWRGHVLAYVLTSIGEPMLQVFNVCQVVFCVMYV